MPAREAFADDGAGRDQVGQAFVALQVRARRGGEEGGGLRGGGRGCAGLGGAGAAAAEGDAGEEVEGEGWGW